VPDLVGTRCTDTVTQPAEYADAGIPTYWIIDLDPPVTLTAPTELTLDLDALLP
jgi:Uma2 family endonuclease